MMLIEGLEYHQRLRHPLILRIGKQASIRPFDE